MIYRKIELGRWDDYIAMESFDGLCADVLTGGNRCDMRTSWGNLSVWIIDEANAINEVVLALCAAPEVQTIESIDIVQICEDVLENNGITYSYSEIDAHTLVRDLRRYHANIERLSVEKMLVVARIIYEATNNGQKERIKKARIKEIITKAVVDGRLALGELKGNVRKHIEMELR